MPRTAVKPYYHFIKLSDGKIAALNLPTPPLHFEKIASGGGPAFITYGLAALGFTLVIVGLAWEILHYRSQQRQVARQRVIVIEARGLRDSPGSPLAAEVPADLKGNRDQMVLDFRQRVKDGVIIEPDAAVRQLLSLPLDLSRRVGGLDRSDIGYVYGGLAPVPLTFLTGVMLDDEGPITIMDWDRHRGSWGSLDAVDDGKRFLASGCGPTGHPRGCAGHIGVVPDRFSGRHRKDRRPSLSAARIWRKALLIVTGQTNGSAGWARSSSMPRLLLATWA